MGGVGWGLLPVVGGGLISVLLFCLFISCCSRLALLGREGREIRPSTWRWLALEGFNCWMMYDDRTMGCLGCNAEYTVTVSGNGGLPNRVWYSVRFAAF
ncbi:uncharacterized protein B0H64DRAFT_381594 [Chaetomium fimeti]|uniref:Uncharacterized protein n=1 Tax=Chaetomium fimeti TaxID=1854472 RepID=A0AAE0HQA9_9PEZI|nr:hypothetical protein B0H64DRAFT_381594 [Chaetomium fimeti]